MPKKRKKQPVGFKPFKSASIQLQSCKLVLDREKLSNTSYALFYRARWAMAELRTQVMIELRENAVKSEAIQNMQRAQAGVQPLAHAPASSGNEVGPAIPFQDAPLAALTEEARDTSDTDADATQVLVWPEKDDVDMADESAARIPEGGSSPSRRLSLRCTTSRHYGA